MTDHTARPGRDPIEPPLGDLTPIDTEPAGPHLSIAAKLRLLTEALREVPLGDHDARVIRWLTGWDSSTVRTIASLIERARAVGAVGAFVDCPSCGRRLDLVEPTSEWVVVGRPAARPTGEEPPQ